MAETQPTRVDYWRMAWKKRPPSRLFTPYRAIPSVLAAAGVFLVKYHKDPRVSPVDMWIAIEVIVGVYIILYAIESLWNFVVVSPVKLYVEQANSISQYKKALEEMQDRLNQAVRIDAERRLVKPSLSLAPGSPERPISLMMTWSQGAGEGSGPVNVTPVTLTMENEGESSIKTIAVRLFRMDNQSSQQERIEHSAKVPPGKATSVDVTSRLMHAICGAASKTRPDFFAVRGVHRIGLILEYKQDSESLDTNPEELYVRVWSPGTQTLDVSTSYEEPNR